MQRIIVRIKPNSRKGPLIEPQDDGSFVAYVREPAVDGKANDALIKLLAVYLNTPKTSLCIARGTTSKIKIIEVSR